MLKTDQELKDDYETAKEKFLRDAYETARAKAEEARAQAHEAWAAWNIVKRQRVAAARQQRQTVR